MTKAYCLLESSHFKNKTIFLLEAWWGLLDRENREKQKTFQKYKICEYTYFLGLIALIWHLVSRLLSNHWGHLRLPKRRNLGIPSFQAHWNQETNVTDFPFWGTSINFILGVVDIVGGAGYFLKERQFFRAKWSM